MNSNTQFQHLGTMLDCSRNAVMNVNAIKSWIDTLSDLGFNTLLLYTEDTYEVNDNPYFGHARGRYSKEELKEINEYALSKDIELIPCIQTLAHLNAITRWPKYHQLVDTADILLAGEEKVYQLLEDIFSTLSECFTSRTINIGMDEAHMIGRGKYYDIHGDSDKTQVLLNHINKVAEIGKKYGFTLCMWSDMFYRLATGDYYSLNANIDSRISEQIPENVNLIYWDYFSLDKNHYNTLIDSHQKIKNTTWFAGGLWTWTGFAPKNSFSINSSVTALECCANKGIKDVFFTLWGDDGGECPKFAVLPSLFYLSEIVKGNHSEELIKKKFKKKYGIDFDLFTSLDLYETPGENIINPEKYLLYNDPFTGLFDSTLDGTEGEKFASYAKKLLPGIKSKKWGYLFKSQKALCDVLEIKATLSKRTKEAYDCNDLKTLSELIPEYKETIKRLKVFYKEYRKLWFVENKPQGFDVQDIRLGGLIQRINHCTERLEDYISGKTSKIDELEVPRLDVLGREGNPKGYICFNQWSNIATANVLQFNYVSIY